MSDVDLVRKRSRSSSPGADSPIATKKSNNHDDSTATATAPTTTTDSSTATANLASSTGPPLDAPLATPADPTLGAADAPDSSSDVVLPLAPSSSSDNTNTNPNNAATNGDNDKMNIDGPADTAGAPATGEPAATISMRALIVTQDASIIIGKGGKNVNEIREKSGSKINITEAVPGNPERVMVIAGQLDAVSKAFGLIVRRINDEPFDVPSVPGSRAVTIRFIIPNARMGSVIGKAGSKIKEIQEASGARLQASEALLPGSTERVLSVSGVADAIHIAVYYIGTILQEHPLSNASSSDSNRTGGSSSYRPAGGSGYQGGGGGGDYGNRPPRATATPVIPIPGQTTQQIFIPNELVGSIIGKAGSKINEIRGLSQCQIKICEPGEGSPGANPAERLVTITGAPYNIQTAVTLLYERLEQEKLKQQSG